MDHSAAPPAPSPALTRTLCVLVAAVLLYFLTAPFVWLLLMRQYENPPPSLVNTPPWLTDYCAPYRWLGSTPLAGLSQRYAAWCWRIVDPDANTSPL